MQDFSLKSANIIYIGAAIAALTLGICIQYIWSSQRSNTPPSLQNQLVSIREQTGTSGALLINFWATWCPPCREEIPDLIRLQQEFADPTFSIIGIALENTDKTTPYANEIGINYPSLNSPTNGHSLMELLGNPHGGLPYTVLLDSNNRVLYQHSSGILNYSDAKVILESKL